MSRETATCVEVIEDLQGRHCAPARDWIPCPCDPQRLQPTDRQVQARIRTLHDEHPKGANRAD